jgi:hypothetical protein
MVVPLPAGFWASPILKCSRGTPSLSSAQVAAQSRDLIRRCKFNRINQPGIAVDDVGSVPSGTVPDRYNEGRSSRRIDEVAAQIGTWLAAFQPQDVLIHVDANDPRRHRDSWRFKPPTPPPTAPATTARQRDVDGHAPAATDPAPPLRVVPRSRRGIGEHRP